jgi:adenine phosphoribosyltransferase
MKSLLTLLTSLLIFMQANNLQAATSYECAHANWVFDYVKTIPDFPKPGVSFKWCSPLLNNPAAFKKVIQIFADRYREANVNAIVGLDSRGFIFGAALAYELNLPFVVVRKAGKIPGDVISVEYELEYGKNAFEMEVGSLSKGQKVVLVDDLIATGGSLKAAGSLVEELGAEVYEAACLIELSFLNGKNNIPYNIFSVVTVD